MSVDADVEPAIHYLAAESNDLIEPPEGEDEQFRKTPGPACTQAETVAETVAAPLMIHASSDGGDERKRTASPNRPKSAAPTDDAVKRMALSD